MKVKCCEEVIINKANSNLCYYCRGGKTEVLEKLEDPSTFAGHSWTTNGEECNNCGVTRRDLPLVKQQRGNNPESIALLHSLSEAICSMGVQRIFFRKSHIDITTVKKLK